MHLVLHVSDTKEELVLASLRYYSQSGLLCSTPGFSSFIDPEKHTDISGKGPKLSTYYAVSPLTGARYEYALDNENDLLPMIYSDDAQLLREIERLEERDELHDVNEWKIKHSDHPEGQTAATKRDVTDEEQPQSLFLSLEIVSAHNVSTTEPVRVFYELHLPPKTSSNPNNHWSVQDEPAAFGYHEEFAVFGPAGDTAPFIRPAIVFTMVSRDSWYREHLEGYAELKLPASPGFYDMNVKLWKPLQTTHDQLEDFFIGMDPSMQHRPTAVAQAASSSGVMSRFGMKTVATDTSLRVRLHVVQRDPSKDQTRNVAAPTNHPISFRSMVGGGKVVKRSVQEILQALQLEKRTRTIGEASRDRTTTILGSSKANTPSAS
ncbi:hypothetical protein Poli38472_008998 [Pythium oligandrum]|uniref:Meckel syndrome type 1 protein n=1 Tax=Pythium oligandrum TaxID=41045 RepID=A0A8K1FJE4_PYTOL|nr:hypothetical protein Poli38472_008998 [Pythium oligandrum]|eukprot:TMW64831.1 hypothetical protein Poli38472_008998 [Pythium oligandrum]